ncbi:MAG TPA: hypothetical protein VK897_24720 [Anaerolineales bacterium]|nr:hypothetical protein [Anaerolineales bacterium]
MRKKILSLLSVLLAVVLFTTTASAGGSVGLRSVAFRPGSLIATGVFTGLGGYAEGVDAKLAARGIAIVACTNQGGTEAPGQNPNILANGEQAVGPQDITKKGTAPLNVRAVPGPITATEGGCPNKNWTAEIVDVLWTNATIYTYDAATGDLLLQRDYICDPAKQTATSVSCTPTN